MFNDKDYVKYEKQLRLIGVTDKQQQEKVLDFMYQLVTIAYGVMEERQGEIKQKSDSNEKEENKEYDTI